MKYIFSLLLVIVLFNSKSFSQDTAQKIPNIAIFSPLFLDSSFTAKGYKFGNLVPDFSIAGVEYLYGANAAIDSLKKENAEVNYFIYDTKSTSNKVSYLISNGELNDIDLIIGSVSSPEIKQLADFANKKKIPFISVTYPNDAGITNNPNFYILNSTLKTNCQQLHKFVQDKFKDQRIIIISKDGKQEERINSYFKEFENNAKGISLGASYVNLGSDLSVQNIAKNFDTTLLTTFIVASADANFAKTIANAIMIYKQQELVNLVGLPTWGDAVDFTNKEYTGLHFYYTSPMAKPSSVFATNLGNNFKEKYGSNPGYNVYRGFESIYKFTKLYLQFGKNFTTNITNKTYSNFLDLDIQPVITNTSTNTLDYFENKKVCIFKRFNGATTQIMQ